jgi:hypothetical protein
LEPAGAESAYKSVVNRLKQVSPQQINTEIFDNFLHEKSHDLSPFVAAPKS